MNSNLIDLKDAQSIWQERLSDKCKFRFADHCEITGRESDYCGILTCPILYKAKLKIIHKFIDLKNREKND